MSELRILVVANQLMGWSQNFITRELVTLRALGVDLRVASRSVDERTDLSPAEGGIARNAIRLPENPFLPRHLVRHVRFATMNAGVYARAWRHFRRIGHDRLHARLRSIPCLFRAAAVASDVRSFDPDLIHAHFLTAPAETALYLSAMCGKPWSATAHAMDIYRDFSGNRYKVGDSLFVTTCTEANRRYLSASFPEAADKIIRIYHGLPRESRPARRTITDPFMFLAVGRMVQKKGFDHLITACSIVRGLTDISFRCRLVGDGELLEEFRGRVRDEGLQGLIELPGRADVTAMGEHYSAASVLVVPSIITEDGDRDGIPNVCLEAMSHGLPIIASEISGLPEVVHDDKNGFLVPPSDPAALADAMVALIEHEDLQRLGRESQKLVSENFDVEINTKSFLETARTYLSEEPCAE